MCVSEDSAAVQQVTDSMQELLVESNNKEAPSDSNAKTQTPTTIPSADNWGRQHAEKAEHTHNSTVHYRQRDCKPDDSSSRIQKRPYLLTTQTSTAEFCEQFSSMHHFSVNFYEFYYYTVHLWKFYLLMYVLEVSRRNVWDVSARGLHPQWKITLP